MNLLHLDSSILGANSVSRILSAQIVARLESVSPDVTVTYRDLAADPIPHLSGAYLSAAHSPQGEHDPLIANDLSVSADIMAEFLAADTVVIGVPFYNFGIPSQLKAWIDRILVAGQTFRFNSDGRPQGLAGNKRVILAIARGGFYGPGMPSEASEHAEMHLRAALDLIGVTDPEVIAAEGISVGPEQRVAALAASEQMIAALTG